MLLLKTEYADVMELVDVLDSKSCVGNYVPVRPRPSANINRHPPKGVYLHISKGITIGGEPALTVRARVS